MRIKKYKWEIVFLVVISVLAFWIRFENLNEPPNIISDENYFVNFARNYISGEYYHDVHPPLGKFFIALGIRIFGDNSFGWRFFTCFFGALLVPLGYFLARVIFNRKFISAVFSFFILFDGMFFVQSRMARLDVIYLFFIFLCYFLFVLYLRKSRPKFLHLLLFFSGLSYGLSFSTKWVALAAGVPIFLIWLFQTPWFRKFKISRYLKLPFDKANYLSMGWFVFYFIIIPLGLYLFIWQIHYGLTNTQPITFYENYKILTYHQGIKEIHALEAPVWSWPLLITPFSYFFEKTAAGIRYIADLGNPLIWWPALISLFYVLWKERLKNPWINLILIFFLAHFLPFLFIRRSLFLYHFLAAAPFLWLILIYLLNQLWEKDKKSRFFVLSYLFLIFLSFVFFFPILTGQEITFYSLKLRWWLTSWFPLLV